MESDTCCLRIAIQKKGRLADKTNELLAGIGLRFADYKNRLIVKSENFPVELLLIRDDDIPEYVQDGVCDLGVVGQNVIAEKAADVDEIYQLGFGKCRLSIAVPKNVGELSSIEKLNGKRLATSYPTLTKNHFAKRGMNVDVVEISGAVEIAPALNVSDAICDLVSTGSTLRANGLIEIDDVLRSQAVLIQTRQELSAEKQALIDRLLVRISGRQKAEKSKYIMMNAPKTALDKITEIVQGSKSPTVLPLADPNMIAVHAVIRTSDFWEAMEQLKEVGASDIVMLPIDSLIQ